MKFLPPAFKPRCASAFTLVELLVATAIGSMVGGSILMILCQTSTEQRHGFADLTVEEKAYQLQSKITGVLRCMSANQGLTPNYSSGLYNTNGNLLGYQSVFVFTPTNGGYISGNINFDSATGAVTYTRNVSDPLTTEIWMTNSTTWVLSQLCFSTSLNLDGSQNGSLVNVMFKMNDNGFSQQGAVNNPASIYRNFSVQMRNDN